MQPGASIQAKHGTEYRSIDRSSPIPLYYQLQEILKEEIEHGRWKPGETIPSEAELAAIFGISRTVIRNALDILEGDGQVIRIKGKGTIVAEPKVWHEALAAATEFAKGASASKRVVLSELVEAKTSMIGRQLGHVLGLPASALAYLLTCVHTVAGTPVSLNQMFLRPDASPDLQSLYDQDRVPELIVGGAELTDQLAAHYSVEIGTSEVIVEATRANDYESGLLGVAARTPVFLVSIVHRRVDDAPIAFTRMIARGDMYRFAVRINGPGTVPLSVHQVAGPRALGLVAEEDRASGLGSGTRGRQQA